MIGVTLSHFRILAKIGEGGMGVVYRAEDERLRRLVALKVLPPELVGNEERRLRFLREARAAAAVTHPNIATIYEVGEAPDPSGRGPGIVFIAMELIEGKTLREVIGGRPLAIKDVLRLGIEITEGLARAHQAHVIHRDLKPDNVIVGRDGHAKILDFGLAKLLEEENEGPDVAASRLRTLSGEMTRAGRVFGTVAYMSPEQARGEVVDRRSDVWSLGVMLYEMAAGQVPFQGTHPASVVHAILEEDPRPIRRLARDVPPALERIILRALQKSRDARYASAEEVQQALTILRTEFVSTTGGILSAGILRSSLRRPRVVILAALTLVAIISIGVWGLRRHARVRWAREQALPEIMRLIEEDRYVAAFALARRVAGILPADPILAKQWPRMSHEVTIETDPPGATVSVKEYATPTDDWELLGQAPMKRRIPWATFQWRAEQEGYGPVDRVFSDWDERILIRLDKRGSQPDDMVRVSGGALSLEFPGLEAMGEIEVEDFLMDRTEVTNRLFKSFVDAGGYREHEYWTQEIVRNGRTLSWEEVMAEFRDVTGRPGPATWSEGRYPEGQDDYPVTGVSWYEAAAYAAFAEKELPTIHHWGRAAGLYLSPVIVPKSNFGKDGPARVCSHQGMGAFGTCDMAGNVKEWVWNETGADRRFILGGAWDEPTYMFNDHDARRPIERSANFGFRCMKPLAGSATLARAAAPIQIPSRDYSVERPVSDAMFTIYRGLYAYDKGPAGAVVEATDASAEGWTKETITLKAPYGSERFAVYLFLPKHGAPPYQTLVFFPGSFSIRTPSNEAIDLDVDYFGFLLRSGRALAWPTYSGTFERRDDLKSDYPNTSSSYRDHVIRWSKEIGASIDYLETRGDIDGGRLGFMGFSWGASMGTIMPAVEDRFKVSVLLSGGLYLQRALPEVDQINFAPRIKIPTLMLNGRHDFFFPVESSQKPMVRFLGTAADDKRYVVYESGHNVPRPEMIKETLNWLDRFLGPAD